MTEQLAFDKIWNWFVVEGNGPSIDNESCRYKSIKDNKVFKCAVGVLIPDSLYDCQLDEIDPSNIEGIIYAANTKTFGSVLTTFIKEELEPIQSFLIMAQDIHDKASNTVAGSAFSEKVKFELLALAKINNLVVPE